MTSPDDPDGAAFKLNITQKYHGILWNLIVHRESKVIEDQTIKTLQ